MQYRDCECKILENKQIAPDIFDMTVSAPTLAEAAKCGQFCNLYCEGKTLRRPISICEIGKDTLRFVYQLKGEGTRWLSQQAVGSEITVFGPLGNGFSVENLKNPVLIGGGIGTPPMLQTAKALGNADVILGFRSRDAVILEEEYRKVSKSVTVCTDDGSYGLHGFVTDALKKRLQSGECDAILACGPMPMLRAIAGIAMDAGISAQVSLEERMGCGIGACLVCVCKIRTTDGSGYKQVCKEGPVFDAEKVMWYEPRVVKAEDMDAVRKIRMTVFCDEQGFTTEEEYDSYDETADFVVSYDGRTPVATGRLIKTEDGEYKIGRVAVMKEYRGRHAGSAIMESLSRLAASKGAKCVVVGAQEHAIEFYEKLGYTVCSDTYMEGHVAHKKMKLILG